MKTPKIITFYTEKGSIIIALCGGIDGVYFDISCPFVAVYDRSGDIELSPLPGFCLVPDKSIVMSRSSICMWGETEPTEAALYKAELAIVLSNRDRKNRRAG